MIIHPIDLSKNENFVWPNNCALFGVSVDERRFCLIAVSTLY